MGEATGRAERAGRLLPTDRTEDVLSFHATAWVFQHSRSTLGTRLVLLALADYAHDDGTHAFPSVPTLAAKAKLSERQTQRALRELVKLGEIEKTGRTSSGSTIYRIVGVTKWPDGTPEMSPEPLEPPEEKKTPTASSSSSRTSPRKRDLVFDAIATACGKRLDALTRTASREIGVAATEIRAALRAEEIPEAEWPLEIAKRAKTYRRQNPTWMLTPSSLKKWWPSLGVATRIADAAASVFCDYCGHRDGGHAVDCTRPREEGVAA